MSRFMPTCRLLSQCAISSSTFSCVWQSPLQMQHRLTASQLSKWPKKSHEKKKCNNPPKIVSPLRASSNRLNYLNHSDWTIRTACTIWTAWTIRSAWAIRAVWTIWTPSEHTVNVNGLSLNARPALTFKSEQQCSVNKFKRLAPFTFASIEHLNQHLEQQHIE